MQDDTTPEQGPLSAEVIDGRPFPTGADDGSGGMPTESVTEPAKVMRIGSMVRQLLEEVRSTQLDEASRERLAEIYERSIVEISHALSPDLAQELQMLALPFKDGEIPTDGELRIAKAQLVGWLEGLFHGIQATLFAQQLAARQQIEQMRQIPGQPGPGPGSSGGTYL
ncbi:MAG: proteasome activator [Acidimicrobiales bacterium]